MRLLATPTSTDCFWNLYQLFPALWMRASAQVCLGWTLVTLLSIVCAYVCRTLSMPHPGFFGPILSFFITALRHCPRVFIRVFIIRTYTSNWGGPLLYH